MAGDVHNELVFGSKQELFQLFEEFKSETKTGWRCYNTKSNFGKAFD